MIRYMCYLCTGPVRKCASISEVRIIVKVHSYPRIFTLEGSAFAVGNS